MKILKIILLVALLTTGTLMLVGRYGYPPIGSTSAVIHHYKPFMSPENYSRRYVANEKFQKRHYFESGDYKRSYNAYMPPDLGEGSHPVVFLFHGSERSGAAMVERWMANADEKGFILIGPDGKFGHWGKGNDKTTFLPDLIADASKEYPIDPERMFLFGHSEGAFYVHHMAFLFPETFLAAGLHGGHLRENYFPDTDPRQRNMPIIYVMGTKDYISTPWFVEHSARAMAERGHNTELVFLTGHNHWYYDIAPQINNIAWHFFEKQMKAE